MEAKDSLEQNVCSHAMNAAFRIASTLTMGHPWAKVPISWEEITNLHGADGGSVTAPPPLPP
jgi:hypothetical protein